MNRISTLLSDKLPFEAATATQRAQALTSIRQLLEWQFPLLSDDRLTDLFNKYEPMLWVDRDTQAVHVDSGHLERLANWIDLNLNVGNPLLVDLYGPDAHYLAKQVVYYTQIAEEVLGADPDLTKPESIGVVRDMLHRLVVGNTVAEAAHRARQWSGKHSLA